LIGVRAIIFHPIHLTCVWLEHQPFTRHVAVEGVSFDELKVSAWSLSVWVDVELLLILLLLLELLCDLFFLDIMLLESLVLLKGLDLGDLAVVVHLEESIVNETGDLALKIDLGLEFLMQLGDLLFH
jgi:hypothetical protein